MENRLIAIAPRKSGEKSKTKRLSSLGVSALILVSDLGWFGIRRSLSAQVGWWEILILVISSVFFVLSLLGYMYTSSNNKYNQKIANEPLISYDSEKMTFVVQNFIEMKQMEFDRNVVNSVIINPENDEATLQYIKNDKGKTLSIGFADFKLEKGINDSIEKYKEF